MAIEQIITLPPRANKAVLHAVLDTEDRITEVAEVLSALRIFIGAASQGIDHETIANSLAVAYSQLEAINTRQVHDFNRLRAVAEGQPAAAMAEGGVA